MLSLAKTARNYDACIRMSVLGNALGNSIVDVSKPKTTSAGRGNASNSGSWNDDELQEVQVTAKKIDVNPDAIFDVGDIVVPDEWRNIEAKTPSLTIGVTAQRGDSISKILGTSNPKAVEAFMRANNLSGSTIQAGREYVMPSAADFEASDGRIGQAILNDDNRRLADAAAVPGTFSGDLRLAQANGVSMNDIAASRSGFRGAGATGSWSAGATGTWDEPMSIGEKVSFAAHTTLGVLGAVPVLGAIPDVIDLAYTAAELPFGKSSKLDLGLATAALGANFIPVGVDQAANAAKIATRAEAAANIRQARNILKDAEVPLQSRNEIIRSFDLETFRVQSLGQETKAFRLFDDSNAALQGRYVSTDFFASQTDRIQNFALMKNAATRLGEVTIPKGSVVFTGRAAAQPNFASGLTGGANQMLLTGSLRNYSFNEMLMPR